jgi:predicted acylesterase/phospholipase RssA
MLQALTANRIRPDLIVGSSVGAVNGAWLASGDTEANLAELADIWRESSATTCSPSARSPVSSASPRGATNSCPIEDCAASYVSIFD